jgi:hypothetical protein
MISEERDNDSDLAGMDLSRYGRITIEQPANGFDGKPIIRN